MPPPKKVDELGKMIREARKKLGINQNQLATMMRISQSYLSAIETGHCTDVGALLIGRLSESLEIPLDTVSAAAVLRAERHRSLPSTDRNDITIRNIAPEGAA